jgi:hypothetical protein
LNDSLPDRERETVAGADDMEGGGGGQVRYQQFLDDISKLYGEQDDHGDE